MKVEIISTGDEIRSGAVVDTNTAHIAREIESKGFSVTRHTTVGDDLEKLAGLFREAGKRCDFAIVTGGLGPTEDDFTAQAAALASGRNLILNEEAKSSMESYFSCIGKSPKPSDKKQAMLPEGSVCIENTEGTAPGFSLKIENAVFFFLPGVPREMKHLMDSHVVKSMLSISGIPKQHIETRTFSMFGIPESSAGERLSEFGDEFPRFQLGLRAVFPVIQVKIYIAAKKDPSLEDEIYRAEKWILDRVGEFVFSRSGKSMEDKVGSLLADRNQTIAVAESCTGGLIGHMLTNVSGSSDYFIFSGVTYSNRAKSEILGVESNVISEFGAVHEETARLMAEGAKRVSGSDYGLSTSGIAGPTGGSDEKPVGTVCIGVATPDKSYGVRINFPYKDRFKNKRIFAVKALDILRKELENA